MKLKEIKDELDRMAQRADRDALRQDTSEVSRLRASGRGDGIREAACLLERLEYTIGAI
jgi:hypothetical protein